MDKALTWFVRIWIGLAVAINALAMLGILLSSATIADGLTRIASTFSPFNLWNVAAELVLISPALGALMWRDSRRKRLPGTRQTYPG